MYLVGAPHPNKDQAIAVLIRLVREGEQFITDVEVYQEILHRYTSIHRLDAIAPAFQSLDAITDDVLTFGMDAVIAAKEMVISVDGLSARDALHAAVMRQAGVNRILSFDVGFDSCPGVQRVA